MRHKYDLKLEDQGQDLLWIKAATDGTITDCGPFHRSLYVGKKLVVKELKRDRVVHLDDGRSLKWPMVRLDIYGKCFANVEVAA